jgi:hypothetical protein
VAGHGNCVEGEEAGILLAGEAAKAFSDDCDALVADEGFVEAAGASVGEDVGDGGVDGVVGREVVGAVVALQVERLGGLVEHDLALRVLGWLDGNHGRGRGAGGDGAEVLRQHRKRGGRVDVADDRDDDVGGDVILCMEGRGLGGGDLGDVGLPADAGDWSRCACGALR